jgi:glycosyltransferase involved in cell wall biosynthesis
VTTIRHVAVVVPARNEADTIAATLASIEFARRRLPAGVSSSCVVVVDASDDDTITIARRRPHPARPDDPTTGSVTVVRTTHRCVGAARALGCRVALAGSLHPPRRVWLANTDADSIVPEHWLGAQVELAEHGADAIAGTVELGGDVDDVLRNRFASAYVVSPDGTHRHVHGANLGARGDVYLRAGGWHRLRTGEDHDLWNRLGQVANCVSSTAITVCTSGRIEGRAPDGFARDIARMADGLLPFPPGPVATAESTVA